MVQRYLIMLSMRNTFPLQSLSSQLTNLQTYSFQNNLKNGNNFGEVAAFFTVPACVKFKLEHSIRNTDYNVEILKNQP